MNPLIGGEFTSPLPPSCWTPRRPSGPKPRFQPQNHEAQPPSRPRPSKTSHPKGGVSPEGQFVTHFETHLGICGRASMFWVHLPGLCVYLPGLRAYLPGLRVYLPGLCVGTFGVSAVGLRCFGSGLRGCGSISQGCAPISQGCASISQGCVLEGQMPCTRLAKRPLGHPRGRYRRRRVVPATVPSPKTMEPNPET